ncbi:MAG TPA: transketolase [bacterium]|nr:transketolase [bacterium]
MFTEKELEVKSILYRKKILESIKKANTEHTAGSLSCIDILNVLYNKVLNVSPETFRDPDRDRYIQSKGHSIEALYVVLADRGFIPESDLDTLAQYQSHYVGHPTRKVNGIEQNTGALGHGLSVSVGLALGAKKDNASHRVFTLLGDGELTEGSNWEALLAGAHYNLDNLTAVVDYNTLQITGRITDVLKTDPLEEKFRAFGWAVRHVNGHNVAELSDVLLSVPFETGTPSIVIARTVKGKGITFMEDAREWHHKVPDDDQYRLAMQELDEALAMYESTVDTDRGRM